MGRPATDYKIVVRPWERVAFDHASNASVCVCVRMRVCVWATHLVSDFSSSCYNPQEAEGTLRLKASSVQGSRLKALSVLGLASKVKVISDSILKAAS